jgi:hypothetical protein
LRGDVTYEEKEEPNRLKYWGKVEKFLSD